MYLGHHDYENDNRKSNETSLFQNCASSAELITPGRLQAADVIHLTV
jgi:hypothetical protein